MADESAEHRDFVVESPRPCIVLPGLPVVARSIAPAGFSGDGVDQRTRRALSTHRLVDEQILQVADVVPPDAGMEQVMGDTNQPPPSRRAPSA